MFLHPGSSEDELNCELKVVDTDNLQPYDALSYRWGREKGVKIFCEDQYLLISKELSEALRRFRLQSDVRVLWVDQICINQESSSEQAAQVRRMGATYFEAREILVWLGEEDNETAMPFALITDVGRQIHTFIQDPEEMQAYDAAARTGIAHFPLALTSADSPEWIAFRNLSSRPWFTRTWRFQELVLSRQASVTCGSYSAPWNGFMGVSLSVAAYDDTRLPGHESHLKNTAYYIKHLSSAYLYQSISRSQTGAAPRTEPADLLNLVVGLRRNETSKESDKIFGVWGGAEDVMRDPVIGRFLDYTQPWEKHIRPSRNGSSQGIKIYPSSGSSASQRTLPNLKHPAGHRLIFRLGRLIFPS